MNYGRELLSTNSTKKVGQSAPMIRSSGVDSQLLWSNTSELAQSTNLT